MATTKKPKKTVIQQVSKKYDKLPDRLRKELGCTIAMILYEKVHEKDNMKTKEQEALTQKLFYGKGNALVVCDWVSFKQLKLNIRILPTIPQVR